MPQNLGETIRRKQQRIVALREEIASLQAELKEARAILSGKRSESDAAPEKPRVVPHRTPTARTLRGTRTRAIKEGSTVWWARHLLQHWKHDEDIDKLIAEIERATSKKVSKPTVVSNLSRYVKREDTFTRPAPSRYGLIDYGVPDKLEMIR